MFGQISYKPLTHCPGCNTILIKKTIPEHLNPMKYENCQARCTIDYFQYYKNSYEDSDIEYMHFNTPHKKFNLYVYFDHYMYKHITHVYSEAELIKHGKASPMLTLDSSSIAEYTLEKLEEKISTLALFV